MPYPDEAHKKERFFCILSYLPKATVQAAIGSVPLAMGLPCGPIVLSVAVLGILITAPAWCHIDRWHLQKITLPIKK